MRGLPVQLEPVRLVPVHPQLLLFCCLPGQVPVRWLPWLVRQVRPWGGGPCLVSLGTGGGAVWLVQDWGAGYGGEQFMTRGVDTAGVGLGGLVQG